MPPPLPPAPPESAILDMMSARNSMATGADALANTVMTAVITNRLSDAQAAKRIQTIYRGKLARKGTLEHLVALAGPSFRISWNMDRIIEEMRKHGYPVRGGTAEGGTNSIFGCGPAWALGYNPKENTWVHGPKLGTAILIFEVAFVPIPTPTPQCLLAGLA